MARIKHYDPEKREWVYSDKAFALSGGGGDYVLTEDDKRHIAIMAAALVEVPDPYTKAEIDAIMGSYITDIDTLVGGDA